MSLNQRTDKENVVQLHTMENYSAIKKQKHHEICKQQNRTKKKIILRKVSQTQKDKHGMYSQMDINYKIKDSHAIIHRSREA